MLRRMREWMVLHGRRFVGGEKAHPELTSTAVLATSRSLEVVVAHMRCSEPLASRRGRCSAPPPLQCTTIHYLQAVPEDIFNGETVSLLDRQQTVAVNSIVLVQQIIITLGNFPEVLQVSDVLDEDASYDERSVIILLVFLASQLLLKQKMDHISIRQLISSCYQSPNGKASAISEPLQCQNTLLRNPVNLALNFSTVVEQGEKANCKVVDASDGQEIAPVMVEEDTCRSFILNTFLSKQNSAAIMIQCCWRCWLTKRLFSSQMRAVVKIQNALRSCHSRKAFIQLRLAAIKWWRNVRAAKLKDRSVLTIQSHVRGWIARQESAREKHRITVIQAFWKGYLVRKSEKKQLFDLRRRIQKSATNVDDDMRLINRHLSALSLLLNHKSISNIRHACSTLNTATEHSEKCCKILVEAGAIDILLKEIQKLTRSGPDQEVLKQILSILRNIARYPSLALKLISGHQSVEIIFQEFLRNKTEGYFVASELLWRLFTMKEGREVAANLQRHVRRLQIRIQELERKVELQKRNARITAGKGDSEQRLKAAVAVLQSTLGTHR
ncbi:hypothetical protein Taro_050717 [Colocasia esculenta]|uniref:Abnormal spindle-like microcephaly-associated protein n=1 Tax=Colocasia esculenta TaxID=4460 RepID=A0A843XET9_COLES|nr:hypothetical protein [Colocasia esculenta]